MPTSAPNDIDLVARRRDVRVPGPFDGRWVGLLTVPIRIFDLSLGGCLIQSFHEVSPGRRLTLEIELPHAGWVRLEAESVSMRGDDGFSVRFVHTAHEIRLQLKEEIDRLSSESLQPDSAPP
jgi:hypothetical protein